VTRHLMVEAAVRGLVDFSEARFFDPGWTRRLKLILSSLQRLNLREEMSLNHAYYLGLLAIPGLDDQSTKNLQEQLADVRERLDVTYRPWHEDSGEKQEQRKKQMATMTSAWEEKYGRMDDPEVQRKIMATLEGLRLQRTNAQEVKPLTTRRKRRQTSDPRRGRDGRRHGR
jgi:hypothetical protein